MSVERQGFEVLEKKRYSLKLVRRAYEAKPSRQRQRNITDRNIRSWRWASAVSKMSTILLRIGKATAALRRRGIRSLGFDTH